MPNSVISLSRNYVKVYLDVNQFWENLGDLIWPLLLHKVLFQFCSDQYKPYSIRLSPGSHIEISLLTSLKVLNQGVDIQKGFLAQSEPYQDWWGKI